MRQAPGAGKVLGGAGVHGAWACAAAALFWGGQRRGVASVQDRRRDVQPVGNDLPPARGLWDGPGALEKGRDLDRAGRGWEGRHVQQPRVLLPEAREAARRAQLPSESPSDRVAPGARRQPGGAERRVR